MTTYYEILEISREAPLEEIRTAYRRLALKHHPDKNPGDKVAEDRFKQISEAYQVLADLEKRLTDLHSHRGIIGKSKVMQDIYAVLDHLMGQVAQDSIPVVTGLGVRPTQDQLKAIGAGAASSGTVAMFHLVGITPEAPTLEAAFQGRAPVLEIDVTMERLRRARRELTTADGEKLDLVVLGSPHFSFDEFRTLAPLLEGRSKHADVQFLVTSSRGMRDLAGGAGLLGPLERFGGRITVDTCILATPMLPKSVKRLMTSSAKYAYYSPGLLGTEVVFGSMVDCVESAVRGTVVRDDSLWEVKT